MTIPLYDNTTHGEDTNVTSLTINHTMSATANGILYVGVMARGATGATSENATWNGDAMTPLLATGAGVQRLLVFGINVPDTGAHGCVVSWTNSCDAIGCVVSFTNASQSSLVGTDSEIQSVQTSNPSITLDSNVNEMIVDFLGYAFTAGETISATAGQTQRDNDTVTAGSYDIIFGCSTKPGVAVSTTVSWTYSAYKYDRHAALCVPEIPSVDNYPQVIVT